MWFLRRVSRPLKPSSIPLSMNRWEDKKSYNSVLSMALLWLVTCHQLAIELVWVSSHKSEKQQQHWSLGYL